MPVSVETVYRSQMINAYTGAGLPLFACSSNFADATQGKKPAVAQWQETVLNPLLDPSELPAVYGVNLPADIVVLDVDPRRFADSMVNELSLLWQELELASPETAIVRTGGDGFHLYFRKPAHIKLANSVPGLPSSAPGQLSSIELKSAGRYVIGAGSLHHTGKQYTLIKGDFNALADLPDALIQRCRWSAPETAPPLMAGGARTDDTQINQNLYIQYLLSCPPAVEDAGGDLQTFKVAAEGRQRGLPYERVFQLMDEYYNPRCLPPWQSNELKLKVTNAFSYATGAPGETSVNRLLDAVPPVARPSGKWKILQYDTQTVKDPEAPGGTRTVIKNTIRNCVNFLMRELIEDPDTGKQVLNPVLDLVRLNRFSDKIEIIRPAPWHEVTKPKHWSDTDTTGLRTWLSQNLLFNPPVEMLHDAIVSVAHMNGYNPLVDWLDSLIWDGKPRLDTWLIDYCGVTDMPITREWSRLPLIGAVQRGYIPGSQFDTLLILEGAEGTGKSSVVRILGGEFYADIHIDPHNKDMPVAMVGKWIMEASEMEFLKRTEISAFRSWFTKLEDRVRPAYGRHTKDFPRQGIFIGTFNPDSTRQYFEDESGNGSGNRRFCPVLTRGIDTIGLTNIREQLFAEAVARFKKGEKPFTTDSGLIAAGKIERAKRVNRDPWEPLISQSLDSWRQDTPLSAANIAVLLLGMSASKLRTPDYKRISGIMARLGYSNKQARTDGGRVRVFTKLTAGVTADKWFEEEND